ncbi:YhcH/YjgK/YiaL family protein [Klebsiella sp. NPDC088457]
MLIASLDNVSEDIKPLTEILNHPDLALSALINTPPGKYSVQGQEWFYIVSEGETRPGTGHYPEFHQCYGDIQLVISGTETIYFRTTPPDAEEYRTPPAATDLYFLKHSPTNGSVVLNQGEFIVFYPGEIHKPMCHTAGRANSVKKLVVKFPYPRQE